MSSGATTFFVNEIWLTRPKNDHRSILLVGSENCEMVSDLASMVMFITVIND